MNIGTGSPEDEAFVNELAQDKVEENQDDIEIGYDIDNELVGISNLFSESHLSLGDTSNHEATTEIVIDFLAAFSDDLFTDKHSDVPTGNVPPGLNTAHSTGTNQPEDKEVSKSDSKITFGLFDDSSDDDFIDVEHLFDDDFATKPLPGSLLAKSKNILSQNAETKSKVHQTNNIYCSAKGGVNPVNSGSICPGMGHVVSKETKQDYTGPKPDDDNFCCICMDAHTNPKTLTKCSHSFCTECIDEHFKYKPVCPVCFVAYGVITGNQPNGYMSDSISKTKLPGYLQYNTIVVSYGFEDGTQTSEHPHPGQPYYGTTRTAYLPNNAEGQKVLKLLKSSFKRRLTFTVGSSRTTGCDNVVTWNDVHHKTSTDGGQQNFGYPDSTYLQRVQEELAARGVTVESLKEDQ